MTDQSPLMLTIKGLIFGPPPWVWVLLVVLIIVGVRASKTRRVPIVVVALLPLLGIMTLNTISGLPLGPLAWSGFGLAYILGVVAGYKAQARWLLGVEGAFVRVRGEWLTLSAMMVIFWANFVQGTLDVVAPAAAAHWLFVALFSATLGGVSGSFLGRTILSLKARLR